MEKASFRKNNVAQRRQQEVTKTSLWIWREKIRKQNLCLHGKNSKTMFHLKYMYIILAIKRLEPKPCSSKWSSLLWPALSGPEVRIFCPCSIQLRMKFFLLINVKMPTVVGILTFMSRKNDILGLSESAKWSISWYLWTFRISCSAQLSMKEDFITSGSGSIQLSNSFFLIFGVFFITCKEKENWKKKKQTCTCW